MPKSLIKSNPDFKKEINKLEPYLNISELFCKTIQGEGVSVGVPSVFLRLKDCTLQCTWCDSMSVWKFGNPYSINEVLDLLEKEDIVSDLRVGHHLILTGGSPLLQQGQLVILINEFIKRFGFKPFIEVENECVLEPSLDFLRLVDQWNNSPKTNNSGMRSRVRYKPEVLELMSNLNNSWFKFVVDCEEDWKEIEEFFLPLIKRDQVILMPRGANQEELLLTREIAVEMSIKYNVRFSDREHIVLWNKKTGV